MSEYGERKLRNGKNKMERPRAKDMVGLTATIPIEIVYASGLKPVDLNNVFITDPDPGGLVDEAERRGFPRNLCAWIKGIYAAALKLGISKVIGVTEGDCSNTHALLEILGVEGVEVVRFGYPASREVGDIRRELERLAGAFGVRLEEAEEQKKALDGVRRSIRRIDELTWRDGKVSGEENHLWLISCSDMTGDYEEFGNRARDFIAEAEAREPFRAEVRLGYMGIPPICSGLYDFCRELGAEIVFNEMQRQFSMPYETDSLVEQYRRYTYPYDIFFRLRDVTRVIKTRRIEAMLHYVQSFCFRQIQDRIVHETLDVPVLTIEFDRPGVIENRTKTRIEAFVEMLLERRKQRGYAGA